MKKGSFKALKKVFGTWQGGDADEIGNLIMSTRTKAEFDIGQCKFKIKNDHKDAKSLKTQKGRG